MKTWQEAMTRARRAQADAAAVPSIEPHGAAMWFADFIVEQQEDALAARPEDAPELTRTLRIVQARCTELLEEVRVLRSETATLREALKHVRDVMDRV